MSVADRLNKLTTDITNAYTSIENKGGTIPANKNTNNLSTAIDSIEVIEQATAEGESLSLTNTKAMPYSDYVVEGKSEQEGEPSPSNPSEIHSVADDVNLALITSTTSPIYNSILKNGEITINGTNTSAYNIVAYLNNQTDLKLKENQSYIISIIFTGEISGDTYKSVYLNFGDTYVLAGSISSNSKITYTYTPNVETIFKLVNFDLGVNNTFNNMKVKIKVQKGTIATSYTPYNQGTVTIKQRGKNLIDNNNLQYDFSNVPNTYNQLETIETGIRYSTTFPDGTPMIIFNTGIDLTSHIGKTIKMKSTISSNAGSIRVGIANADTSLRQYKANTNISNKEISFLVTDDLGEKKYLVYYLAIDVVIGNTADFKNLTLTIDEEPIYEPYQANDYTIQTEPLRSLPNGVKDTIEADGIHRRVGRIVLDGSENGWYQQDNTSYSEDYLRFTIGITDKKNTVNLNSVKYNIISDVFTNKILDNNETRQSNAITGQYATNLINIFIAQNIINGSTVESFKTWLSTHNTEVLYELETEIIEPLTQNQATTMLDIIKTGSYEGTTNIYTDEDVKPTIGVGYYKKG